MYFNWIFIKLFVIGRVNYYVYLIWFCKVFFLYLRKKFIVFFDFGRIEVIEIRFFYKIIYKYEYDKCLKNMWIFLLK